MNKSLATRHQQISRLLILTTFASLLLGHLQHYQLSNWLSFYAHDIFLSMFLLINLPSLKELVAKFINKLMMWWQKPSPLFMLAVVSLLVIVSSWFFASSSLLLLAFLYTVRLLAYLLFMFLFVKKNFFAQREKQQLLLVFFILFLLLSWGQYLFFADLRSLGYLGFDDHQERLIGLWFDPAFTGLALLFAMIYFIHTLPKRFYRTILLVLALAGLLLTFSRAVYLALLAVMITTLLKSSNLRARLLAPAKIFFFILGLLIAGIALANFAKVRPSNSLWRTHSVIIRWQSAKAQLTTLTFKDWLIGRGLFIPSSSYGKRLVPLQAVRPVDSAPIVSRQTANFSDNLIILLISFFGLPLALIYLRSIFAFWYNAYQKNWSLFLIITATLVVAQFNQTVFQPLIFLLLNYFFWSDIVVVGGKLKK